MVKLSKGGSFLKAKDVSDGETIVFSDEGTWETSDKYKYADGNPQKYFVMEVDYKGEKKRLKINAQSRSAMIEAYGDDTKDWVGKAATMFVFATPNGNDKMIVLKAMKGVTKNDIDWEP